MKFAVFSPIVLLAVCALLDTKLVQGVPIASTLANSDVAMAASADSFSLAQSDVTESEKHFYLGQLSSASTSSPTSTNHSRHGHSGNSLKDPMVLFAIIAACILGVLVLAVLGIVVYR